MRILTGIDVPFRPFGGSLLCTNDWYSDLADDIEARYLTLHPPEDQPEWWTMDDVRFLDVEKQLGAAAFAGYTDQLRKAVLTEIEDYRPDIIHSQHLNYGLARVFADLDLDIPKIGICHGTDVQLAVRDPFFKDNMERICDAMDTLVFPNENMRHDFFEVYGKPKDSIVNPLGIPDRYYSDTPRQVTFDGVQPLRVLYAGRLLDWKGADVAVEAMKYAGREATLTVIGNEDERDYKQKMTDFVAANRLDNVRFLDQMEREELFQEFGNYDVIVFPSKGLEAFSLTLIEAQIHGLPVIAADSGGIVNTMGDSGILLPENSPQALARQLKMIRDDPSVLHDLQSRGYRNAEKYRMSASKARLFDLSQQLIAHSAARTPGKR